MPKNLLSKLRIKAANAGTCTGPQQWLEDAGGTWLVSNNPTTGREIARVRTASPAAYETTVKRSRAAFESWRSVPAPQRGQLVRDLGNALRAQLEPLGELIALEVGKIRAEGVGEVQEMIDICDFAVGLSRQLYGLTMHSESAEIRPISASWDWSRLSRARSSAVPRPPTSAWQRTSIARATSPWP